MPHPRIAGVGMYVPERIVTNAELSALMDTSHDWIIERTGIEERRFFADEKDTVSGMAAHACQQALEMANKQAHEVDLIVFATLSPDYYFPGSGVLLQRKLGFRQIPTLDIRAQCSGFIYSLSVAEQYIKTGAAKNVLVVGSEVQSNILECSDRGRNMAVIFGDGAGAVLLEATEEKGKGILSTHLHSDGKFAEELYCELPSSRRKERFPKDMIEKGLHLPYMNGKLVFMNALKYFPEAIMESLTHNGFTIDDLDLLIPHQANLRITKAIQKEMNLPDDKVVSNIQKYGNTTAASIPIALYEAYKEGRVKEGSLICMASFGSGFMWGSALIRW